MGVATNPPHLPPTLVRPRVYEVDFQIEGPSSRPALTAEFVLGSSNPVNNTNWREVVGKNVHATISKGNMGYDQQCILSSLLLILSFSTRKSTWLASRAFLPIHYEEQSTQNHQNNTFRDDRVHISRNNCIYSQLVHPLPVGILNHVMFHLNHLLHLCSSSSLWVSIINALYLAHVKCDF